MQHQTNHHNITLPLAFALLFAAVPGGTAQETRHSRSTLRQQNAIPAVPNYVGDMNQLLHWSHFPLRVAFRNQVTMSGQDLQTLAQDGFDSWTDGTDGAVTYQVVALADRPDVIVSFDKLKTTPGNMGTLGTTYISFESRRKTLYHASVHLNIWPDMSRYSLRRFQLSAAHEFGHALGLNGHSHNPEDVMYFSSGYSRGLTWRDLNTLKIAYRDVHRFDSVPFLPHRSNDENDTFSDETTGRVRRINSNREM